MTNFNFSDDGVFSRKTYSGMLAGQPDPAASRREIKSLKEIAKSFCWLEPYVVDSYTEPLPKRGNVAWITSHETIKKDNNCGCGSHACVIWFDDGNIDVRTSMQKMLQDIDWEEIAENFDY